MAEERLINGDFFLVEESDRVYMCPDCSDQILLTESEWFYSECWECEGCGTFIDLIEENEQN